MKAIVNGKVILKNSIMNDGVVLFDKRIKHIMTAEEFTKYIKDNKNKIEIVDANGNYISPGFIDIHIHGAGGCDTMDASLTAIETIADTIAKSGVTSFFPTTMTMSKEKIYKALNTVKEYMNSNYDTSKVIGVHMEGPFISETYKGAQKADYIIEPDIEMIKEYLDIIKVITYAPETDKNNVFINYFKNQKTILSIGHSNATYEEAFEATEKGVYHFTHLFNAMSPFNHRKPGVVGAAFKSDAYVELIADTIHVNPAIYEMLIKLKGKEKILLITDSMRAGGMKDGLYELGGQNVYVKDNSARLEEGTLAGSILTLNKAVKNMYENTNLSIFEAVNMASLNQATELNIDSLKGSIEEGKDADIIVFDENFDVKITFSEGNQIFKEEVSNENNSGK